MPLGRRFQSLTVRGMKELLYLRVWPWLVDRYGSSPFEASLFVARVRPVYDMSGRYASGMATDLLIIFSMNLMRDDCRLSWRVGQSR